MRVRQKTMWAAGVLLLTTTGVSTGCAAADAGVTEAFGQETLTPAPVEPEDVTSEALTASLRSSLDLVAPWVSDEDVSCVVDLVAESELSDAGKKAIIDGQTPVTAAGQSALPESDQELLRDSDLTTQMDACVTPLPEPEVDMPKTGLPPEDQVAAKLDYLVWNGMGKSPDGGACVADAVADAKLSDDAVRYVLAMDVTTWSQATEDMTATLDERDQKILLGEDLGSALGTCLSEATAEIAAEGAAR